MDACYPFLPALLRSPFRLRDNLLNFGSSDPPSKLWFFRAWSTAVERPTTPRDFRVQRGRDYGALTSPVWLKITHLRLRGAYKSRVVKDHP